MQPQTHHEHYCLFAAHSVLEVTSIWVLQECNCPSFSVHGHTL